MRKSIKKFVFLLLALGAIVPFLSGCSSRQTLLFLNWGEYINEDLIAKFEEEYNCNLIVDIADSNELFYSKLKNGTTKYDLCCPAEYMVEKMYLNGLIQEIDFSKLSNYSFDKLMPGVLQVEEGMNQTMIEMTTEMGREYKDNEINYYHVPYFWGTFGLLYNKINPTFKDEATYNENHELVSNEPDGKPDILQKNDAWKVFYFDPSITGDDALPESTRVGMYSAARFTYGFAMQYYAGNPNVSVKENINAFKEIISRRKYTEWSGDQLKHNIASHNLDIAVAYTGDCMDMGYIRIKEENLNFEDLEFYVYVPAQTVAHVDTLVIPSQSRHVDLAHKFLDFICDPDNAWLNNRDIGYCPPLQEVYDMIVNAEGPKTGYYSTPESLTEEEIHWRENWAKAMRTTFPVDENNYSLQQGTPLSFFTNDELKQLNNVINNVKSRA